MGACERVSGIERAILGPYFSCSDQHLPVIEQHIANLSCLLFFLQSNKMFFRSFGQPKTHLSCSIWILNFCKSLNYAAQQASGSIQQWVWQHLRANHFPFTTFRTERNIHTRQSQHSLLNSLCQLFSVLSIWIYQLSKERNTCFLIRMGQETKIADFHKTFW